MQPGRLNAKQVEKIVRDRKPGYTADGGGLYLQVSRYGTASWVFRYRLGTELNAKGLPKLKEMGLGPHHTVSLSKAREKAQKAREQLLAFRHAEEGAAHPIADRRAKQVAAKLEASRAVTFRQAAEGYVRAHQNSWTNAVHAAQWPRTLEKDVFPVIGDLPVAQIDTALVMRVLEPIWSVKRDTAARIRGRIEAVLDWAGAQDLRQGENPARWARLKHLLADRDKIEKHHPALPYSEVGTFMTELRANDSVSARALEFTILTAARTAEVLGMQWPEVDLAERTWTVPAERMKNRKEHRIPLSTPAIAILEKMAAIRCSDFVFPGERPGQPLWPTTMIESLRRIQPRHITVHGFRSTFRDWVGDRTSFPEVLAELALAHRVGDKTERAYRRGTGFEKRRQLADAWAKFCGAPAARSEENVESIGARRRA